MARSAPTSDGEVIASPRFARESAGDLAAGQQALARKERGSANRRRARAKVAEVHRRIRNRRWDFHHKTARTLVNECDVIALEDLRVVNMTRFGQRHAGAAGYERGCQERPEQVDP